MNEKNSGQPNKSPKIRAIAVEHDRPVEINYIPKHSKPTKREEKAARRQAQRLEAEQAQKQAEIEAERRRRAEIVKKQRAESEKLRHDEAAERPQSSRAVQGEKSGRAASAVKEKQKKTALNENYQINTDRSAKAVRSPEKSNSVPKKANDDASRVRKTAEKNSVKNTDNQEKIKNKKQKPRRKNKNHKKLFSAVIKALLPENKSEKSVKTSSGEMTVINVKAKKRRRLAAFLSFAAAILALIIALNITLPAGLAESTGNFFSGLGSGNGFPVSASSSASRNILNCGGDIALLSDSALMLYKNNGRLIFNRQHGYSDPGFSTSDGRILVFDRNGSKFKVENRSSTLCEINTEHEIITGDICHSGGYAVASRSDSYICDVTVYDKNAKQLMVWHSSARQVSSLSLSSSGKYLAVGTVDANGGEYVSGITVFKVSNGSTVLEQNYADSVLISLDFKGDNIIGVFSNMLTSVNLNGTHTEYNLSEGTMTCFSNNDGGGVAITVEKFNDTGSNQLLVFDRKLKQLCTVEIGAQALSVSLSGSKANVLAKEKLMSFSRTGVLCSECEIAADAKYITTVGSKIAVLKSSQLDLVKP